MVSSTLDQIIIRDLLVRGIIGVNADERANRQDILVNVTLWADLRPAAVSDDIADTVNYRTITKALVHHIEHNEPRLVERLAADLINICFEVEPRVQAVELSVEKPGAVRFTRSVGVTLYRQRQDLKG